MKVAQTMRNVSSLRYVGVSRLVSKVASSDAPHGRVRRVAKRNIHFVKVMPEYFCMRGLNIPR